MIPGLQSNTDSQDMEHKSAYNFFFFHELKAYT